MVRNHRWFVLLLCLAGGTTLAGPLAAQPLPAAPSAAPGATADPNPLPGLPHPPDQPANLYAPMPAQPYANTDPMPAKYFTVDPLLDPPGLQPGWVTSVQATWTKPVVVENIYDVLQVGARPRPDLVHLPVRNLSWTVVPRIEAGYRLPSGFGEFALAYRGLSSSGNSLLQSDQIATLRSRLAFNIIDLDYISRDWALGPNCRMDWRIGARMVFLYLDSQSNQPFDALTAAGSGILSQRITNWQNGFGPHCGLELSYNLPCAGLALVGNCDVAGTFGRIKQGFYETAVDVTGLPVSGSANRSSSQPLANVIGRLGLAWQAPSWTSLRIFAGYESDIWWEVGRLGPIGTENLVDSSGQMWNQGFLLRVDFNW